MLYAFDPRVRYLSGPGAAPRRRRLLQKYGLGDDIPTTDSPLPSTLTPPDLTSPPIVNQTPWQLIGSAPIPTSSSPLPSTLTPPAAPSLVNPYPNIAAGNAAMPSSFWTGSAIPGISNTVLVYGIGGLVALMLLAGGKKKR